MTLGLGCHWGCTVGVPFPLITTCNLGINEVWGESGDLEHES